MICKIDNAYISLEKNYLYIWVRVRNDTTYYSDIVLEYDEDSPEFWTLTANAQKIVFFSSWDECTEFDTEEEGKKFLEKFEPFPDSEWELVIEELNWFTKLFKKPKWLLFGKGVEKKKKVIHFESGGLPFIIKDSQYFEE